jgi:hypothetical protein
MNKTIDGKQCTILWHVDDLKISHEDSSVVTDVISKLNDEYGKKSPLTIRRGKIHDYLGMVIDYSVDGRVQITMDKYITDMLNELPLDTTGVSATPAGVHLFEVNKDNPKLLDTEQLEFFHHYVAKLLFLCKRARPDIQTAVAFLCTRVKQPDDDDYKELTRVMKYLRGSPNLPLILEGSNIGVVNWWFDASFAVHTDMRSHTGAMMTFGKGAVYATSTRQRLNTKSSTEAELVGVSNVLPQIIWTRNFFIGQGYQVDESIIHQDNQSAILLESNGKQSSSRRTRHLNIQYFFVTDHVHRKEVRIQYCPTEEMVGDFFTKPLQGVLFYKFRNQVMNYAPTLKPIEDHRSVLGNSTEPFTSSVLLDKKSIVQVPETSKGEKILQGGQSQIVCGLRRTA